MNCLLKRISVFGLLLAVTGLSGCGGGGGSSDGATSGLTYSGSSSPVAINVTNAESLAAATAEGAVEGVSANSADSANPFAVSISGGGTVSANVLAEQMIRIANIVQSETVVSGLPIGLVISSGQIGDPNFCGGTVTVPNDFNPIGLINASMTFTNLCFDDGSDPLMPLVLNGTMVIAQASTSTTIEFRNLNVTNSAGESVTVNSSVACDTTGVVTCTAFALYEGSDGAVYKIEDYSVSGNNSAGYQLQAAFYHPTYGRFDITTTTALTFNCTNGKPDAGTISLTGASGSSATITFTGCNNYSGTWYDGVSSGMFSDSWL
ncbi:MAG: hypothetical protein QNK31_01855 [Porticoccus sp.]|nr:hypothetical protein [Porticoccus sp.]